MKNTGVDVICRFLESGIDRQNSAVAIVEENYRLELKLPNGEEFLQARNAAEVALQDIEAPQNTYILNWHKTNFPRVIWVFFLIL
jgi:hypothetical protein